MLDPTLVSSAEPDLQKKRWGFRSIVPRTLDKRICFTDWFGNENPVEIEIGCGKGYFLLSKARKYPNINFIGLDWSRKWLAGSARTPSPENLSNIRFLWVRAQEFLERIQAQSVAVIHVYFPDPWPKRRHGNRRLVQADFLDQVHKLLQPGGLFELATDFEIYFDSARSSVVKSSAVWQQMKTAVNQRILDAGLKTHYEQKFETEGRNRFYMELQK